MSSPAPGLPRSPHHGGGRARVLVHVGQRLLDDPVGGAAQHVRRVAVDVQVQLRRRLPAVREDSTSAVDLGHARRRGEVGAVRRVVGAQHAEHAAQVLQRLAGRRPDQRRRCARPARARRRRSPPAPRRAARSGTPCGPARRASPGRSGAARRAGPGRPRSSRSASARLGPLAQRRQQVAPSADVGAEREHRATRTARTPTHRDDTFAAGDELAGDVGDVAQRDDGGEHPVAAADRQREQRRTRPGRRQAGDRWRTASADQGDQRPGRLRRHHSATAPDGRPATSTPKTQSPGALPSRLNAVAQADDPATPAPTARSRARGLTRERERPNAPPATSRGRQQGAHGARVGRPPAPAASSGGRAPGRADPRLSSGVGSGRTGDAPAGPCPDRMDPMITVENLTQAVRPHAGRRRRQLHLRTRHRHRLPRPERRRQVDHAAHAHRADPADRGARDGRRPALPRPAQPGPGRRRHAGRRGRARRPHRPRDAAGGRPGARRPQPGRRRDARARRPGLGGRTSGRASTRSACASGSASRSRCSATRPRSSWTSRPTAWTPRASAGCASCCRTSRRAAAPCCCPATCSARCRPPSTGWSSSARAASWPRAT